MKPEELWISRITGVHQHYAPADSEKWDRWVEYSAYERLAEETTIIQLRLERECDEARAEAKRRYHTGSCGRGELQTLLINAEKERDEAKASVEIFKIKLVWAHNQQDDLLVAERAKSAKLVEALKFVNQGLLEHCCSDSESTAYLELRIAEALAEHTGSDE